MLRGFEALLFGEANFFAEPSVLARSTGLPTHATRSWDQPTPMPRRGMSAALDRHSCEADQVLVSGGRRRSIGRSEAKYFNTIKLFERCHELGLLEKRRP